VNTPHSKQSAEFDAFAGEYNSLLEKGLSITGECGLYFIQRRIEHLQRSLRSLGISPATIMDYGCGVGTTAPELLRLLPAKTVVGVDISEDEIAVARSSCSLPDISFHAVKAYQPAGTLDLAYCNGVFHHIPPSLRLTAIRFVYESLKPGGVFAFYDNNPWSPAARYVMRRIPFDRNAIMISAGEASQLLKHAGFEVISISYLFIFPRFMASLRFIEPILQSLPVGAQYQVLCKKPLS
jgi:SAM-dependent methyltransferase